jgi:16S rRNA (cytosine967-C5)-methyltransferase
VNAVLRTFGRTRAALTLPARPRDDADRAASLAYLTTSLSHPEWLAARWLDRYGLDAAEAWCRFNNRPPELTIRPVRGVTVDELLTRLAGAGVEATAAPHVMDAVRLAPGALGRLPPDVAELCLVHDEGAQLVARAVNAMPGDRVVDLCAAPGGKTVVLAADLAGAGVLVACDVRDRRVRLLRTTLRRGHVGAHVVQLDATRALPFGAVFDRVLLDAPCSGLGTVRRDPDLKWSRTPADFEPLQRTQRALIDRSADVVAPGGSLLYATCSSEPEENDAVVDEFLATHPEFSLDPVVWHAGVTNAATLVDARGFLRTLPFAHGLDAYFAAVLVRRRTA